MDNQGLETILIGAKVLLPFMTSNIKDVNEDSDILEYGIPRRRKVRIHEMILAPTIPEIENHISQKANIRVFNIDYPKEKEGGREGGVRTKSANSS